MIKSTTEASGEGVISAYSDNSAVIEGFTGKRLMPSATNRQFEYCDEPIHILMKVETHNHPTAISPFPGAATGSGGEIRDEGATGLGARPKAGLSGFTVSHLRIPQFAQPWEQPFGHPERMATPLEIMLEGPVGAAAFNNEFGRPNLLGYFRTFEARVPGLPDNEIRGYHKPIMIAGGVGNVRAEHALKQEIPVGAKIVVIGGPAMLIGLGGGAASSLASGSSREDLDFASVQRGNPEIQLSIDRDAVARYDLSMRQVTDALEAALEGSLADTQFAEFDRRINIRIVGKQAIDHFQIIHDHREHERGLIIIETPIDIRAPCKLRLNQFAVAAQHRPAEKPGSRQPALFVRTGGAARQENHRRDHDHASHHHEHHTCRYRNATKSP